MSVLRGHWLACPTCGGRDIQWRGDVIPLEGDPSRSKGPVLVCLGCGWFGDQASPTPTADLVTVERDDNVGRIQ